MINACLRGVSLLKFDHQSLRIKDETAKDDKVQDSIDKDECSDESEGWLMYVFLVGRALEETIWVIVRLFTRVSRDFIKEDYQW